ncbi:hypothetical protein BJ138DRAFT_1009909 [Hygrophoropsis aurantiaca]|uniref:Uncharacterized protein n=1 Tax=Hygrophoropsis aurantiaca TaxID=72124 RepID=A0ACB8A9L5_9AGAM|nr:hypothetical protein BJ138DRAFT_1009909 [Hygrophoropsis aurantiaca]
MSNSQSLQANSFLPLAENTDPSAINNHGIVDGRPEGRRPDSAPVTLDTVVDKDASTTHTGPNYGSETVGATSADVHKGLGVPVQGMSSKELRHDGQPGRKRQGDGAIFLQKGNSIPGSGDIGERDVEGIGERR